MFLVVWEILCLNYLLLENLSFWKPYFPYMAAHLLNLSWKMMLIAQPEMAQCGKWHPRRREISRQVRQWPMKENIRREFAPGLILSLTSNPRLLEYHPRRWCKRRTHERPLKMFGFSAFRCPSNNNKYLRGVFQDSSRDFGKGTTVLIPRIDFLGMTLKWSRRQLPIYAVTINKSQGESYQYVGINLETPVCGSPDPEFEKISKYL